MPVTRFTLILGLGHCQEAPKDLAQLPPPAQVLSPLLLASRGPDSPVAATAEMRGLQAWFYPTGASSASLPTQSEGVLKIHTGYPTPHTENSNLCEWQSLCRG